MKLYNVIVMFDQYVVAESPEEARATILAAIVEDAKEKGEVTPTEQTALEARSENNIRESKRKEKPLVGSAVSDEDFNKLKGKTNLEIYQLIYTKKVK